MKAIINPYNHSMKWSEEFFPGHSVCSLPVAGKEFSEFQVDAVSTLGVSEILLLDYNYDSALRKKLGRGERWSLSLHYLGSGIRRDPQRLVNEHLGFADGDDLLLVMGPIPPEFEGVEPLIAHMQEVKAEDRHRDGVFLHRGGVLYYCPTAHRRMRTLHEYFELNFQVMHSPRNHVLPGYRVENGVHTGMNVVIMPGCEITPPVVLCDNICLERDCRLEQGVVIGHDTIIDSGNILRRCVVFDHTYIGKNMEFVDKIVASGRIIDPINQVAVELEESGISSSLDDGMRSVDWTGIFEYWFSLLLAVVFLVPFLVTLPLQLALDHSLWSRKCSFDRYPELWKVVFRCGHLIRRGRRNEPYVFCFSDGFSIRRDPLQQKLDDRYYAHHRTPYLVVKTAVKAFINRMFITDEAAQDK